MQKVDPTRGVPKGLECVNCDASLSNMAKARKLDTILLCERCYTIADHMIEKCRKDLARTLDVYTRILVAAAMEKKLQLPYVKTTEEKTSVPDTV
ncbi:hypothetical protein UFOVP276_175 [uncultured Caudovirales phage]|uniref:Uncharacterized protein n=1 Tax=uncultured Caudovirales phage TaxID=2100421 RepID=A0A6J5LU54_9CAUD|nr:hypothetical protein UFOVP127_69 [uncultured Caudovirales phage]CAB4135219.1 hypothetical protein UFOVP276_175 [uncultured Caudovirales phage]